MPVAQIRAFDMRMQPRDRIDTFGTVALVAFSALLGFNQVVIRVVNDGLQPVFFAGLRSAGAVICLWLWMSWRGQPVRLSRDMLGPGLLIGTVFAAEFIFLFIALDLTTVTRTSVVFYTMPLWLALGAHFLLAGDAMSPSKATGLALAFAGVCVAILWREGTVGEASLLGDFCALMAALCWAGVALLVRATRLKTITPEAQLIWQVAVSAPILLLAAPFFGPLLRELQPIHLWGLAFQIVVVVSAGFSFWLWLLSIYPASGVAAFSFLGPIFGVFFGWWILDERLSLPILIALALVVAGLILINRPAQVPQKV